MKIIINETAFINLFEAANLDDIYQKYYSNIPQDDFSKIIQADPTWREDKPNKMGKYGKWLLTLYKNKHLKIEDLYKAKEYLTYFIQYNNVIDIKDINQYKSLTDLYHKIKNFIEDPDQATSKQDAIRKIKEGAEKVYEDEDWIIIIPHTEQASCYYGKGTQWCTAAEKSRNMFDSYNEQGYLYININKKTHEKYQFHFETSSFMDDTDTPINDPICSTIGLSDGALDWYKNNVKEWEKLCEESIIIPMEDGDNIYIKRKINSQYWYIVDDGDTIATDLIINQDVDSDTYFNNLKYDKYLVFKNAYGFHTLLSYDTNMGHLYLCGTHYTYVNKINNDYADEYTPSLIETVDNTKKYEVILIPDNYDIYSTKKSDLIHHAKALRYDIIGIFKKNGLVDLINYDGYELSDIKLIDGEIQTTDDEQYGIVLDQNNNKIIFDFETLDENFE